MAPLPRSGLFGFLLLLGALLPPAGLTASRASLPDGSTAPQAEPSPPSAESVEARLRRITAALRAQDPPAPAAASEGGAPNPEDSLQAWAFLNGPNAGFRNGGWRNGGFNNGGWRNGGFYNGGFRNGGGWRNGGFLNRW